MSECRKVPYQCREDARMALKRLHGVGRPTKGLRPYKCECGFFHLGHLSSTVISGKRTRGQVYREGK